MIEIQKSGSLSASLSPPSLPAKAAKLHSQ